MGSFGTALFEALVSAGVSHDRARAVVDLFNRSVDERYSLHGEILATKRDVAEVHAWMAQDRGQLETRMAQLDARIAQIQGSLEARIAECKADLVKWMLAALTAQTALLLGAIRFF